jgi:hypothetical protein
MMHKLFVYILLIVSSQILAPIHVMANTARPPNTLNAVLKDDTYIKVGETTFSILFWDLYKSKLQTTSGKYPIECETDTLIYNINYLADISGKDLIERTVEQWQHLGINPETYQVYLPVLENIWPDIEDGDTLSLHVINNKSMFYFNNDFIGEIVQPEFSQLFLDIWLSKNTSEPELRLELLGVNNNE